MGKIESEPSKKLQFREIGKGMTLILKLEATQIPEEMPACQ